MSYRALGSYYMIPGAPGYSGFGEESGGLGELFFDGGKAFWRVMDASETLSSIAQKVYGNVTAWPKIWDANPQGRWPQGPPGCPMKPDCKGWYKVGTILELPKIPGFPDPMATAPTSGMAVAKEGTTVVTASGQTATVGKGGVLTGPGSAKAAMGTGTMIGIGVAALALIGGMALLAKKKPGAAGAGPGRTTSTSTTTYKANLTRRGARRMRVRRLRSIARHASAKRARKTARTELRRRGLRA